MECSRSLRISNKLTYYVAIKLEMTTTINATLAICARGCQKEEVGWQCAFLQNGFFVTVFLFELYSYEIGGH